jgi:hypothetical protein
MYQDQRGVVRGNAREAKLQKEKDTRNIAGKKLQTSQPTHVNNNYVQIVYHPSTAKGSQSNT